MIKAKKRARFRRALPVYLMMLPALLYFLVNNYLPMFGIILAFKNYNFSKGLLGSDWCGLANFTFLFSSGNAWYITRNTILYNLAFIVINMVLGITVAILLNEIRSKVGLRIYQTVILLPYLMSWVVVSYLSYAFLSGETGFINNVILPMLGVDKTIAFYQQKAFWPFILIFVNTWKSIGFNTIIYYSCVIGIPAEYYEAAKIDGAKRWAQIKNITLPSLKPTIITLLILSIGKVFYSDFGLFYQVPKNSGMLYQVTDTIDTYVYRALMVNNNFGMSAAAGFYQSIVGFVLVVLANQIIRMISRENAMF